MMSRLAGAPGPEAPFLRLLDPLVERAARGDAWLVFHLGAQQIELDARGALALAARWGRALERAGVRPGDRVLVLQPNRPGFVGAFFGAHLAGAVPVPAPWPFSPAASAEALGRALAPALAQAEPRVIAAGPGLPPLPFGGPVLTDPEDRGAPAPVAVHAATSAARPPTASDGERLAFVQFTSGTSGVPRGAMIGERAALHSAWVMGRALGLAPGQTAVSWLPFFHDMGLVGALLTSLLFGVRLHVLTPHEFLLHPDHWLALLSAVGARVTVAPNFAYELAVRRAARRGPFRLGALEVLLNGAEPVRRSTLDHFEQTFAPHGLERGRFRPAYGLAEATLGVCFAAAGGAPDLLHEGRPIPAVGTPLEGMSVEVRDPAGAVLAQGTEGEIFVAGPSLMSGYQGAPEETRAALQGGWLRTGDLGVVQGGQLHVTGRKKELLIKGGQKFHPHAIEQVAAAAAGERALGAVALARESARSGSEELVVLVELAAPPPGVEARIRGELLGALGVLADEIRVVGPGRLPRTSSGKLRRAECARLLAEDAWAR